MRIGHVGKRKHVKLPKIHKAIVHLFFYRYLSQEIIFACVSLVLPLLDLTLTVPAIPLFLIVGTASKNSQEQIPEG